MSFTPSSSPRAEKMGNQAEEDKMVEEGKSNDQPETARIETEAEVETETETEPAPSKVMDRSSLLPRLPSNLNKIVQSAHATISRIDELERKLDERAMRLRRRTLNIMDPMMTKPYRSTHLRCFLTHSSQPAEKSPEETVISIDPVVVYSLRIEGKLLIGHLDHVSADEYDKKTNFVQTSDDYLDRNARAADKEEDDVLPIKFTHLFERVEVEFQTTYSPRPHPMAKKKAPVSKKRRGSTKSPMPTEDDVIDPKDLVLSAASSMVWTKELSPDAHAFDFKYTPPPTHDSRFQLHSIIAKVKLFPNKAIASKDPMYEISPNLANDFFPKHAPLETEVGGPKADDAVAGDKRKADESLQDLPAMEDSILIPPEGLTMRQIVMAFFTYIQDNQLCDELDKSTIVCDAKLQKLLGVERFNFSGIQQLLAGKYLVRPVHTPVKLTHIMKEETCTNYQFPPEKASEEDKPTPSQLQFDMDVNVPAFFPFRARELLRRIKRRELEYTSSRTKARYLLMARKAKDEEEVKAILDQVVSGHQHGADHVPVFAALAKAAPPHSEARMAAHCDQRMSYLLPKAADATMAAKGGWDELAALVEKIEQKAQEEDEEEGEEEVSGDVIQMEE